MDPPRITRGREVQSSLVLQMVLYYNVLFSILYAIITVFVLRWKILNYGGWRLELFTPYFFAFWCVAEIGRLYNGYVGNLQEKVPNLTTFVFLTFFPQFLFCAYFLFIQHPAVPFDKITNAIMFVFLIVEMFVGLRAVRRIIANKTARFAIEYAEAFGDEGTALVGGTATFDDSLISGVGRPAAAMTAWEEGARYQHPERIRRSAFRTVELSRTNERKTM